MSYLDKINQFWQTQRIVRLTPNEAILFLFLVHESNIRQWENPFECPNGLICVSINISEKTLIDVRNRLQQKGFISVDAGKRKQKSPVYTLLYCKSESINVSKKVSINVSKTVSKNPNLNNKSKSKSKTKKEEEEKADRFFPNKNEVIDFFMSQKELKPSEAESQAESFYAHFSEIDKSISFDWREEAKIWQSKISPFKGEKKYDANKCSSKGEKSRKSKVNGKITHFKPPTVEEVDAYCKSRNNGIDAEHFVAHYEANGWMRGKTKIKDWEACVRTWEKNNKNSNNEQSGITESLARNVAEGIARANNNK